MVFAFHLRRKTHPMPLCSRAEPWGGEQADNRRRAQNKPEHGTQKQIDGNK